MYHTQTFQCQTGNLATSHGIKHDLWVNRHGGRGRGFGILCELDLLRKKKNITRNDGGWKSGDSRSKDYRCASPHFLSGYTSHSTGCDIREKQSNMLNTFCLGLDHSIYGIYHTLQEYLIRLSLTHQYIRGILKIVWSRIWVRNRHSPKTNKNFHLLKIVVSFVIFFKLDFFSTLSATIIQPS